MLQMKKACVFFKFLSFDAFFDFCLQVDGLVLANFGSEPMPPKSMRKQSKIGFFKTSRNVAVDEKHGVFCVFVSA